MKALRPREVKSFAIGNRASKSVSRGISIINFIFFPTVLGYLIKIGTIKSQNVLSGLVTKSSWLYSI